MKKEFIILAAGKGKRMISDLPKVLLPLGGEPMLFHIMKQAAKIKNNSIKLVIGNGKEQVQDALEKLTLPKTVSVKQIIQEEQRGTGHAVAQAIGTIANNSIVTVLYGDVPLLQKETIARIVKSAAPSKDNKEGCAIWLTAQLDNPSGYGRIVRNSFGKPIAIVEEKDCNIRQKEIKEVNTGIMSAPASAIKRWLKKLMAQKPANKQKEYLLTDLMLMAKTEKYPIRTIAAQNTEEFLGANDMQELARLERILQMRLVGEHAKKGVYFRDPARIDILGGNRINFGKNVQVGVNVIFSGNIRVGNNVNIGNNCIISDVNIGNDTEIKDFCHIQNSRIGKRCILGPYARLRPQSIMEDETMLGNFVEVKKSTIGKGSKASHLSYIGNSKLGPGVNFGAGAITCNYDGKSKHETKIKDGAFIGSNTSLVAPVTIGKNAMVGAGSVITEDIPAANLAISRSPQKHIKNYHTKSSAKK